MNPIICFIIKGYIVNFLFFGLPFLTWVGYNYTTAEMTVLEAFSLTFIKLSNFLREIRWIIELYLLCAIILFFILTPIMTVILCNSCHLIIKVMLFPLCYIVVPFVAYIGYLYCLHNYNQQTTDFCIRISTDW